MAFSLPDGVGETEPPYLDALASVFDYIDIEVESRFVESETVRATPAVATEIDSRTLPSSRIHYLTAGEGPPVPRLHGIESTAAAWVPMVGALSEHFTVYTPDRPGRGLSAPVDYGATSIREFLVTYLVDVLYAIGIEETAVVWNALGGFQTLTLTADHPGRVIRIEGRSVAYRSAPAMNGEASASNLSRRAPHTRSEFRARHRRGPRAW